MLCYIYPTFISKLRFDRKLFGLIGFISFGRQFYFRNGIFNFADLIFVIDEVGYIYSDIYIYIFHILELNKYFVFPTMDFIVMFYCVIFAVLISSSYLQYFFISLFFWADYVCQTFDNFIYLDSVF